VTTRSARGPRSPLAWLGGLLALYLLVPLVAFAVRFATSADRGFGVPGLGGAVATSAVSATIATAVATVLGVPLALWLSRTRGRVAAATGVLVQLPLALPPVMSGIVLVYLVGPYTWAGRLFGGALTESVTGIVLAQVFVSAPFLVIAARSAFAAIDPALDDLAATLGHRPLARFLQVQLRVATPAIVAGMLLTWLRALGEYGATVLLAYHPYSLPVFTYVQFSSTGIPATQAPTAIALAVAVAGVLLTLVRRPRRAHPPVALPLPRTPRPAAPVRVELDLAVRAGAFTLRLAHAAAAPRVAVLGPSGSGKSMTLRAVAGLLGPDVGRVVVAGQEVGDRPAETRHVGYVPQGAVLFPGRTVWQQVTAGVDADPRVAAWWLATLRIEELAGRLPDELSGGQRQRVALAAALAREPRLLLLDEPFAALDAPVRTELRRELRRLQRDAGLSTVLVTHDPEEAAQLADELLVLDAGRLLQAGGRREVFDAPAGPQVARLLGYPPVSCAVVASAAALDVGGVPLAARLAGLEPGRAVVWTVRPDRVALRAGGGYAGTVVDVADEGLRTTVTVRLAGSAAELTAPVTGAAPGVGKGCRVDVAPEDVLVWPVAGADPAAPRPGDRRDAGAPARG